MTKDAKKISSSGPEASVLGRQLRFARVLAGIESVGRLAKLLNSDAGFNISARSLYDYERGRKTPPLKCLFAIAAVTKPPGGVQFFLASDATTMLRPDDRTSPGSADDLEEVVRLENSIREFAADDTGALLNRNFTFEYLAVNSSNRLAVHTARLIAERPGVQTPTVIWGAPGVGKTHLLCAIVHEIYLRDSTLRVRFANAEEFANDFAEEVRGEQRQIQRRSYREANVLLFDDVQVLASASPIVKEEFLHTFEALHTRGRQIVIAGTRSPSMLEGLPAPLRSRLSGGLVLKIDSPDITMLIETLYYKTRLSGKLVPKKVLTAIVGSVDDDMRLLEGRLAQLVTYASLEGRPVTVGLARELFSELVHMPADVGRTNASSTRIDNLQERRAQREETSHSGA